MKIIIRFATCTVEAELLDTPTARAIYEALPMEENVNRWGECFWKTVLAGYGCTQKDP